MGTSDQIRLFDGDVELKGRLPHKKKVTAHRSIVGLCCLYVTWEWHLFTTRSDFLHERYSPFFLLEQLPKLFIVYSLGLWLSATKWGQNHPKSTALLMVPSALISFPMVSYRSWAGSVLVLGVVLWSYAKLFRYWRSLRWSGGPPI